MKRVISILFVCIVLFSGCSYHHDNKTGVYFTKPNAKVLPEGFEYQSEAGNGWCLYSSPVGYFLVSVQGATNQTKVVEIEYIGRELLR